MSLSFLLDGQEVPFREGQTVLQAALAGSDVMTMSFDIMQQLYQHPLTDVVLDTFLKDWAKIPNK